MEIAAKYIHLRIPLPWGGLPRHPRVEVTPKVHKWLLMWFTSGFE